MAAIVPPIKCQGIKTKIIPLINSTVRYPIEGRWIEPFCGSCVVAINIKPERAILGDTNPHIIKLYQEIQSGVVHSRNIRKYLEQEGAQLAKHGEGHYYLIRDRFNSTPNSFDFIFLNRACFNGVMRFNQKGRFNVPFCRKPNRFAPAYITKIVNQVAKFADAVYQKDWTFVVADFTATLDQASAGDVVYADPPYAGRHVDYFNSWNDGNEASLARQLRSLPCDFILSTWHSNDYRDNAAILEWKRDGFHIQTTKHFYHVGSTEDLRNPMIEALVTNFTVEERLEVQALQQIPLGLS